MLFIKLEKLETVNELCKVCNKYKDKMDVDIKHGRYIVDGCNNLAVASLIGNIVKVVPVTNDRLLAEYFYRDMKNTGAYEV